ncbi:MAG TPA: outer membrane protein assembly factor BamD [Gemmatimonadales bacterium]|nr:outer membrane protein assembly factor BamD [Gemmatimonadales bacterium]
MTLARRLLVPAALALAAACGRGGPEVAPRPETLLNEARREFRQGHFRQSLLLFQRLIFELPPGHPDLPEVRYYLAESHFQTGDRVQAASEFRRVADQHPASPYAPLALLRAGDAHLRMWRRPELDPTPGQTALAIYQELAGRYPGTDAAARAQLHVRQLREWFADKAYKNGMFYLRRKAYDSAIIYFKDVVANYPDTPRAPDALLRLVDTYRAIGYGEEREETCAHLRRFYPQAAGLAERCPAPSGAN